MKHPGYIIRRLYLNKSDCSVREFAKRLDVEPTTINNILNEKASISPVMAHRLGAVLGNEPIM